MDNIKRRILSRGLLFLATLGVLFTSACSEKDTERLYTAAKQGNITTVKELIEKGVDVNTENNDGLTALHYASNGNHIELVKDLIKQGADVNKKCNANNGEFTPLMLAVHNNYSEIAHELIKAGADVNIEAKGGWTALHYASHGNHAALVKDLIEQGADINKKCETIKGKFTPLMLAVYNNYSKVAHELIKAGADVNAICDTTEGKRTPLMLASINNQVEIAKELIKANADINIKDDNGDTAFTLAARCGNVEFLRNIKKLPNLNKDEMDNLIKFASQIKATQRTEKEARFIGNQLEARARAEKRRSDDIAETAALINMWTSTNGTGYMW